MDAPAYTDRQKQILRQLRMYYEVTPRQVRFDEHDKIIADGHVELLMGTERLQVEFAQANLSFFAVCKGLRSLHGAPAKVKVDFDVAENKLDTLLGGPSWVGGDFVCWKNNLTSLEGAPEHVGKHFIVYSNPLTSLAGMPRKIGVSITLPYSSDLPLLRSLVAPKIELVPGNTGINLERMFLCERIINRYAGQGRRVMHLCAKELIAAGFEENAKW